MIRICHHRSVVNPFWPPRSVLKSPVKLSFTSHSLWWWTSLNNIPRLCQTLTPPRPPFLPQMQISFIQTHCAPLLWSSWVKNTIKLQLYQFIANRVYPRLHQGRKHWPFSSGRRIVWTLLCIQTVTPLESSSPYTHTFISLSIPFFHSFFPRFTLIGN